MIDPPEGHEWKHLSELAEHDQVNNAGLNQVACHVGLAEDDTPWLRDYPIPFLIELLGDALVAVKTKPGRIRQWVEVDDNPDNRNEYELRHQQLPASYGPVEQVR